MSEPKLCPQCKQALPADAPEGLCPACLLKPPSVQSNPTSEPTIDLTESKAVDVSQTPADHGRLFTPPPLEEIARRFPQLEVLELIGRGGMGAVYKVRQSQLERIVALKILPPEVASTANFTERFMREARALAKLNHPNIVSVYDFGVSDGYYYIIMEYVEGVNLRSVLRAGALPPAQALALIPQICEALQFAHEEGIVHRDIKPENILLDKKGRVKIADFGLAKLRVEGESNLTASGSVMGTLHYMAPEQLGHSKDVDHRADIFSLGVVFYELLTGDLPLGHFQPPSKKKVEVDVRLDEVVLKTLEQEPARRYQKASDVKTQVEHISSHAAPKMAAAAPVAANPNSVMAAEGIVNAPAIALMILGALISLSSTGGPILNLGGWHFKSWIGLTSLGIGGFDILLGAGIIYGGWQMQKLKSYGWAQAAAIMSMLPFTPFCVFGILVGLWALMTLKNPGVRAAFESEAGMVPAGTAPMPQKPSGLLWLLVPVGLGVCVIAAIGFFLASLFFITPVRLPRGGNPGPVTNIFATSTPSPQQLSELLTRQIAELKGLQQQSGQSASEQVVTLDTNAQQLYELSHAAKAEASPDGGKSARELLHACSLAAAQLYGVTAIASQKAKLLEIQTTIKSLQDNQDSIVAMPDKEFQTLTKRLSSEAFDDGKMNVLRPAISKYRFTSAQAKKIVAMFSFPSGKVESAEALYPRTTDQGNYHQVLDSLTFPSDKQRVQQDLGL